MGRAGGLVPLLCCLLLGAVLLPGSTVKTPDEEGTLATPGHNFPVSAESEVDLSAGTTSPPLSAAPKDTDVVLPGTIGPEEMGQTTEAVAVTERPVSEEDSGSSKPTTTVVSSRGDSPAEVYGNSTTIVAPAPTEEVVPTDPIGTVEVVKTTQSPSSTPPRDETATLVVTETVSSTVADPTSLQANLTEERTQSPDEARATSQNVTELGDTTTTPDVLTSTTRATTILTSTITKATVATSTTLIPSAKPTSKVASEEGKREPSVLDVGDDRKDLPSVTNRALSNTDPLVVAVISAFIVMVGILAVVGFLRYRQRNSRTDFRRLQDLPMDDMMEDTPLSLYSY